MRSSYYRKVHSWPKLSDEQGYSLVELMVAMGLISIVALLISQFSTTYRSKDTNLRRACESYTTSLIGVVQEETHYREVVNELTRTQYNSVVGVYYSSAPPSIMGSRAFPVISSNPIWVSQEDGGYFFSNRLIYGSMRSLVGISRTTPDVLCQLGDYSPITANALPVPAEFLNSGAQVRMRLDPYRISTGEAVCASGIIAGAMSAPSPVPGPANNIFDINSADPQAIGGSYLAAYQNQEADTGTGISDLPSAPFNVNAVRFDLSGGGLGHYMIANKNALDSDLGVRMTVEMTYAYEGQNYSCSSTQSFEYPPDRAAPPAPNRFTVTHNSSTHSGLASKGGVWNQCDTPAPTGTGQITLQVGYQGLVSEPGVQFLCRDLSWVRTPTTEMLPCVLESGGGEDAGPGTFAPFMVPAPASHFSGYLSTSADSRQFPSSADKTSRDTKWVICDHLSLCGEHPSNVVVDSSGGNRFYELTYDNLPFGCHVNAEAVAVDTAGNRSSVNTPTFVAENVALSNVTVTGSALVFNTYINEMYYPACGWSSSYYVSGLGVYCTGADAFGYPTSGYYTCRADGVFGSGYRASPASDGCCIGENCRPWN